MTGDGAYGGNENYELAENLGLEAWLKTAVTDRPFAATTRMRQERVALRNAEPALFAALQQGHQNVESVNRELKARIKSSVTCRNIVSIRNELLCYCIVHNLLRLVALGKAEEIIAQGLPMPKASAGLASVG